MNRRGFFQTIAAAVVALCLPKSEKAELVIDDDQTYTFGQDDDTVFTFKSDSNDDGVTIDVYAEGFDGSCRKLTEGDLRYFHHHIQSTEENTMTLGDGIDVQSHHEHCRRWGLFIQKENQNG